jgi:tetratricopeptide (TPR) repeat protein
MRAAWLLAAASLMLGWPSACAATASSQTGSIEQHSEGACSPPIIDNQGQISISCQGLNENAQHYLENKLTEQFSLLSEKLTHLDDSARTIQNLNELIDNLRKQADDWAQRYRELSARLAESRDDSAQAKQARELIQQGEFAKAEAILQVLATKEEDDVARTAATQYDLSDLAMLRFDPAGALPHYEKAFRYRPDNPRYADGYAQAAYRERHYAEAERGFTAALQLYRDLADRDPGTYGPYVAGALNNLGLLHSEVAPVSWSGVGLG